MYRNSKIGFTCCQIRRVRMTPAAASSTVAMTTIVILATIAPIASCQMTDAEHRGLVELHNRLRRSVQPEAANMNQLVESASLRALAQRAAETCQFEHNYSGDFAGKGENLYMGGSNASLAVMLWFIERENYRLSTGSEQCGLSYGNSRYPQYAGSCGHYYQVAQGTAREVGCGKKDCSGNFLIVCEYNIGSGSPPYTAGRACSKCGSLYPRCLDGLCVPVGTSNSTCSLDCTNCNKLSVSLSSTDSCGCTGGTYSPCYKCDMDATQCLNNGTDAGLTSTSCNCICPANFYGDQCQYNRAQFASAIQLRFGGELRSRSYFPVPKNFWPSLWLALQAQLTGLLTEFCRSSPAVCCPSAAGGSNATTTNGSSFLTPDDLHVAASGINVTSTGELAVSLVATADAAAPFCGGGGGGRGGYVNLAAAALIANLSAMREQLAQATLACCGVNLTLVTTGMDQADYWPQGQGAAGGGAGGSGSGSSGDASGGIGGAWAQSIGEPLNSVGTALLVIVSVCTLAGVTAAVVHRLVSGPTARIGSQLPQQGASSSPSQNAAAEAKVVSDKGATTKANVLLVERL